MYRHTIPAVNNWFTNPKTKIRESGIFLKQATLAFYNSEYHSGNWKIQGTIENLICTLKNDITPYPDSILLKTTQELASILRADLPKIQNEIDHENFLVCIVPRAKANYLPNQLLFKQTIIDVITKLNGFENGANYIIRHTDTKTTHLSRGISNGGNGNLPYPGITKETCTISNNIKNKFILLIDDLYTKNVNIDEDAIQALLDHGAKNLHNDSIQRKILIQ
jgi:hypothetical protein